MKEGNLCDLPRQQEEQKSGTFLFNGAIFQWFRTNPKNLRIRMAKPSMPHRGGARSQRYI